MRNKLIKNKYIAHEPHESVQSSVSTFQTDRERENQKVGGMTKSGTEKKRTRRAGAQNAGKDSSDNNSKVRYNLPRSFPQMSTSGEFLPFSSIYLVVGDLGILVVVEKKAIVFGITGLFIVHTTLGFSCFYCLLAVI